MMSPWTSALFPSHPQPHSAGWGGTIALVQNANGKAPHKKNETNRLGDHVKNATTDVSKQTKQDVSWLVVTASETEAEQ